MCLSTAGFTEVGTVLDCSPAVRLRTSNPLFAYRTYASDSQRKGVHGSDVPQLPRCALRPCSILIEECGPFLYFGEVSGWATPGARRPTGQSRVLTSRWSDRERAACARL